MPDSVYSLRLFQAETRHARQVILLRPGSWRFVNRIARRYRVGGITSGYRDTLFRFLVTCWEALHFRGHRCRGEEQAAGFASG